MNKNAGPFGVKSSKLGLILSFKPGIGSDSATKARTMAYRVLGSAV